MVKRKEGGRWLIGKEEGDEKKERRRGNGKEEGKREMVNRKRGGRW